MAELIIPGPAGRIEARYTEPPQENAPIALILHPHPRAGGTMQDPITIRLFQMFEKRGFGVLRFNTRGVGRSQGVYDQGVGELEDAAYVLDYMENLTESPRFVWCAGYSFGAWITLQLLMRRPEIDGFLAIAPPCNHYDLSFLAPCPASGLIISGEADKISGPKDVERALTKVRVQKGEVIERDSIAGANHFFQGKQDELLDLCETYVDRRLIEDEQKMRAEVDTKKVRGQAAIPNKADPEDSIEGDDDDEDDDD
ncbi:MAG: alpha/beta hydrolase [Henriciella sp.]|uniref:alpha/beta hydrolase n=1 Tax=Henriciella sp. TaxID=1968823 RepID=UPI003C78AFDE